MSERDFSWFAVWVSADHEVLFDVTLCSNLGDENSDGTPGLHPEKNSPKSLLCSMHADAWSVCFKRA